MTHRTVRSLRTSELHSETDNRKRITFDDFILKKLGHLVAILTSPKARDHAPYSDGDDLDSVQLLDNNDPTIPDSTDVLRNTSLKNRFMNN